MLPDPVITPPERTVLPDHLTVLPHDHMCQMTLLPHGQLIRFQGQQCCHMTTSHDHMTVLPDGINGWTSSLIPPTAALL